jgi:hypothetical protein
MLVAMSLTNHLQIQARANQLANHRLHTAMVVLTQADFHAPRTSFFPRRWHDVGVRSPIYRQKARPDPKRSFTDKRQDLTQYCSISRPMAP